MIVGNTYRVFQKEPATFWGNLPYVKLHSYNKRYLYLKVGRDSSVCIATRYGLDAPRIQSRWGERFSAPVQNGLEAPQPPVKCVPGVFPGVKVAGA